MSTLEDVVRLLPDYELGAELGRGNFGVVWRARHRQLERDAAVKQLAAPTVGDDTVEARFRREARLLASLDHPHVVRVYDYREDAAVRLLVMELLTGGTLADRHAAGMTLSAAVASVMAAASGLHYVHEHGVLHRDVKPENLMFDGAGTLKVTDFGIARSDGVQATAVGLTRAGEFFGTPAYIAPEQAAPSFGGGWPPVGPAADQYALAAVLYELLSGRFTHDPTDGWIRLCTLRMNDEATPLRTWVPELAAPVEAVVMRALRRDPADRYPSVEAFGVALGRAMTAAYGRDWYTDSSVAIRDPGPIRDAAGVSLAGTTVPEPEPARSSPRTARLVALFVVVFLLAAGATVAVLALRDNGGKQATPPGSVAPADLPLQLTRVWSAATRGNVIASPAEAGGTIVVGSEDESVYGFDAATGAVRWQASTDAPIQGSAAISGSTAYVGSLDGYIYALDATNGKPVWKHQLPLEVVSTPVVSGGLVLVGADGLYALDATDGTERWHAPTGDVLSSPSVANGAVVFGSSDGNVYGAPVATGAPLWRVRTGGPVRSSPTVANGTVYVGSDDSSLYAIDLADPGVRWKRALGAPVKSSPVVTEGVVVVGTDAGRLVALRTANGSVAWTLSTPRGIHSSPRVLRHLVVVGADDGNVYAVRASDGVLQGRYATGAPVVSSPLVVGTTVYVGSQDHRVHAIGGFG
jgi:outer membrane protein assembly factor BamB